MTPNAKKMRALRYKRSIYGEIAQKAGYELVSTPLPSTYIQTMKDLCKSGPYKSVEEIIMLAVGSMLKKTDHPPKPVVCQIEYIHALTRFMADRYDLLEEIESHSADDSSPLAVALTERLALLDKHIEGLEAILGVKSE